MNKDFFQSSLLYLIALNLFICFEFVLKQSKSLREAESVTFDDENYQRRIKIKLFHLDLSKLVFYHLNDFLLPVRRSSNVYSVALSILLF